MELRGLLIGLVGIVMVLFSLLFLDPSSTLGSLMGILGWVMFGTPFYVNYKLKKQEVKF